MVAYRTKAGMACYCRCGAALRWTGSPWPDAAVLAVWEAWKERHRGEGHGGCDARTAARARRATKQRTEATA